MTLPMTEQESDYITKQIVDATKLLLKEQWLKSYLVIRIREALAQDPMMRTELLQEALRTVEILEKL